MKYDAMLIDVHNIAYRTFNHRQETPTLVSKKQVYKTAICNFIRAITELKEKHLHSDGDIYLLFDNPTSRIDLQSSFYFADRKKAYAKYKQDRAKEPKEFYNSIGLIKYYYLLLESNYKCIQISRLEADDLVKPLLDSSCKDKNCLLVSNDLDWTRYLSDRVQWLPHLGDSPESAKDLERKLGFPIREETIVAFKSLFGDPGDNIPSIASPTQYEENFTKLAEKLSSADQLIQLAYSDKNIEEYPVLKCVREQERQYRINMQLVRSIPVAASHLENATGIGRNALTMRKAVERAIGLIEEKSSFTFGNIKRPRAE